LVPCVGLSFNQRTKNINVVHITREELHRKAIIVTVEDFSTLILKMV